MFTDVHRLYHLLFLCCSSSNITTNNLEQISKNTDPELSMHRNSFDQICHDVDLVIHNAMSNFDQLYQNVNLEANINTKDSFADGFRSTFVN